MDKVIKGLKITLLIILILIGVGILGGLVFVYNGIKSGDLESYATEKALETVTKDMNLTSDQEEMLESGNYEGLVSDLEEDITQEQIDCAVQAVGEERAKELMETQDPTPQEMIKLSKCL